MTPTQAASLFAARMARKIVSEVGESTRIPAGPAGERLIARRFPRSVQPAVRRVVARKAARARKAVGVVVQKKLGLRRALGGGLGDLRKSLWRKWTPDPRSKGGWPVPDAYTQIANEAEAAMNAQADLSASGFPVKFEWDSVRLLKLVAACREAARVTTASGKPAKPIFSSKYPKDERNGLAGYAALVARMTSVVNEATTKVQMQTDLAARAAAAQAAMQLAPAATAAAVTAASAAQVAVAAPAQYAQALETVQQTYAQEAAAPTVTAAEVVQEAAPQIQAAAQQVAAPAQYAAPVAAAMPSWAIPAMVGGAGLVLVLLLKKG